MGNDRVEEPGQQRRGGGCETAQRRGGPAPVEQATKQLLEAQLLAGAAELERAGKADQQGCVRRHGLQSRPGEIGQGPGMQAPAGGTDHGGEAQEIDEARRHAGRTQVE